MEILIRERSNPGLGPTSPAPKGGKHRRALEALMPGESIRVLILVHRIEKLSVLGIVFFYFQASLSIAAFFAATPF